MAANIEHQAFTALYYTLQTGIQSGICDVIGKAFSKGLVPPHVHNVAGNIIGPQSDYSRASIFLNAIQQRIQNLPSTYEEFACVLDEVPAFRYLAVNMRVKKNEIQNPALQESELTLPEVTSPLTNDSNSPFSTDIDMDSVDNTTRLGEDDVADIAKELSGLEGQYYTLGLGLHLSPGKVDVIRENNHHNCLTALFNVIVQWSLVNYNNCKFGPPTWRLLVQAVNMIDHERAKQIANKHQILRKRQDLHIPLHDEKENPQPESTIISHSETSPSLISAQRVSGGQLPLLHVNDPELNSPQGFRERMSISSTPGLTPHNTSLSNPLYKIPVPVTHSKALAQPVKEETFSKTSQSTTVVPASQPDPVNNPKSGRHSTFEVDSPFDEPNLVLSSESASGPIATNSPPRVDGKIPVKALPSVQTIAPTPMTSVTLSVACPDPPHSDAEYQPLNVIPCQRTLSNESCQSEYETAPSSLSSEVPIQESEESWQMAREGSLTGVCYRQCQQLASREQYTELKKDFEEVSKELSMLQIQYYVQQSAGFEKEEALLKEIELEKNKRFEQQESYKNSHLCLQLSLQQQQHCISILEDQIADLKERLQDMSSELKDVKVDAYDKGRALKCLKLKYKDLKSQLDYDALAYLP